MGKEGLLIYVLLTITSLASGKHLEECERSYGHNSEISLTCRLRTLNSEFDKTNLSSISGDLSHISSLKLVCSDVLFYQSTLQPGSLAQFSRLVDFQIEHCKLSRLSAGVFQGLSLLKNVSINTLNTNWAALSLELDSGTFDPLSKVEIIDLSQNNIWTFPEKIFCSSRQLATLNVSLNRLQDIGDLSFKERDEKEIQLGQGCKVGLQVVDLSFNRLILLPPRGLSALTSLKELYLQGNEISVVADRALGGLKNLKILNLSGNKIVALPTIFEDSKEITEIYLQNNSLSSLSPKLFAGLDQLVVLDLSHNILSNFLSQDRLANDINDTATTSQPALTSAGGEIFSGLIRLVLLNLGFNRLTRLSAVEFKDLYSLQVLNLEFNEIDTILPNTFISMNNLHTLILSHNKLIFIDASAFNGLFVLSLLSLDNNGVLSDINASAFSNCSSLRDLNLNGNALTQTPLAVQNLTLLKTIDLGENQITQLSTPPLIGLPNLYGLRVTGNKVQNLSREDLKELPSLKVLNLARNRLQYVEKGSFDSNTNLQAIRLDSNFLTDISNLFAECPSLIWLNVSDNAISWFDYALVPKQIQWVDLHKNFITELGNQLNLQSELQIKSLDASFNRISKIGPQSIPDSVEMLYLNDNIITYVEPGTLYNKMNLTRLDLFSNQIESIDIKSLQLSPHFNDGASRAPTELYLAGNPLVCDCNSQWLQEFNKISNFPKIVDLDSVYCKLVYNRERYYVPLVEAVPSDFLCSYTRHCFHLCQCCDFACDCEMTCPNNCTCYHDDTWNANIVDCAAGGHDTVPSRIPMDSTEVYLDGNDLKEIVSHQFIGRKNLRVLFLNSSNIEVIHNNSMSGLKRLQILHLEGNYLTKLHGYEFEPLESVREIYLQSNQISYIANGTFSTLRLLEVLILEGNLLKKFSVWSLSQNPYLVEIALSNNPFSCDCDWLQKVVPFVQTNVAKLMNIQKTNCIMNGKSLSLLYLNSTKLSTCTEITALSASPQESPLIPFFPIVISIFVAMLICSVFIAVCRRRNSLRIWAVAKCLNQCGTLDDDREKLYDAYVMYSPNDEFQVSKIMSELQGQCDKPYRLCLHYKDFPVSCYISDTIVEAVSSSRRTIMVLSKSFIQTEWNNFKSALHVSLRGSPKNRLLCVTLGDMRELPTLDPDLRVCLRSATILSANDKTFFSKLRCALPNPRASFSNSTRTLTRPGSGSSVASSVSNNYNCSTGGGSTLPLNLNVSASVNHTMTNNSHLNHHNHQHPHLTFNGTIPHHHHPHHNNSVSVPMFLPPLPPPNLPPYPAPRRPPPPTPLWA